MAALRHENRQRRLASAPNFPGLKLTNRRSAMEKSSVWQVFCW